MTCGRIPYSYRQGPRAKLPPPGNNREQQVAEEWPEHRATGDGGGRRHEVVRGWHRHQRTPKQVPSGEEDVGPAARHEQSVQPEERLTGHVAAEDVPHNASDKAGRSPFLQGAGVSAKVCECAGYNRAGSPDSVRRCDVR